MELIQKYLPINKKEIVDALMTEISTQRFLMTPENFTKIFQSISKKTILEYFKNTYQEKFNYSAADEPMDQVLVSAPTPDKPAPPSIISEPAQRMDVTPPSHPFSTVAQTTSTRDVILPPEVEGNKKYVFGTYIEMAFHNFYITLNHIYGKVIGKDAMAEAQKRSKDQNSIIDFADENEIWNPIFNDLRQCRPEQKAKAEELLYKHFAFLTPALDFILNDTPKNKSNRVSYKKVYSDCSDFEIVLDVLQRVSHCLRIIRNVCSHSKIHLSRPQKDKFNSSEVLLLHILQHSYLGAKRIVRQRFGFSDYDMACAEQYKFEIDKSHRDAYGHHLLKKKIEKPGFKYAISNNSKTDERHFSAFGIVMLACWFLEKKYAKILTDKLHCIRKRDEPVIGEIVSVYRTRLFIRSLSCEKAEDAIALDMLNELQRCPKELFDLLSPADQKRFRIKAAVAEDTEENEVLMIRHSDRFSTLVMKYFDEAKIFKSIRFQVALGKYFHTFYNKRCIDSDDRVRSLSKDVTGYGRISEIEQARKDLWKGRIREYEDVSPNTSDSEAYITDHRASYIISGHRIGMRLIDNESGMYIPDLQTDGVRNLPPTCWMSEYELPAMAFLQYLKGDSDFVEQLIRRTIDKYTHLFNDISNGILTPQKSKQDVQTILTNQYSGIKLEDIPKKMQDYLLAKDVDMESRFNTWARELLQSMIERTERMQASIDNKIQALKHPDQNKIGKKSFVVIKSGALARFLAKDIMFFQGTNKLNSLNFNILQSVLATYSDGNSDALRRVFNSAKLVGRNEWDACNPIITRMCRRYSLPRNTVEFYREYLVQRRKFLSECLDSSNYSELYFLYSYRSKWQERSETFYRDLAARYLHEEYNGTAYEKAIELPRGLFERAIRKELETMASMRTLARDKTKNVSYLICGYFKNEQGDDCQPFYGYGRNYPLFNDLYRKGPRAPKVYRTQKDIYDLLNRKSPKSIYRAIAEHIENFQSKDRGDRRPLAEIRQEEQQKMARRLTILKNTETTIKRYRVEDMVLFLFAKQILMQRRSGSDRKQSNAALANMTLKSILKGDVLSQPISFSVNVKSESGYIKTIFQEDMKLRDYVRFYRFLSDRRMPTLLSLIKRNKIDRHEIENEFENYDKVHPHVLQEVLDFEASYFAAHGDTKIKKGDYLVYPEFYDMIKQDADYTMEQQDVLRKTRNSFAHVSYVTNVMEAKLTDLPKKAEIIASVFSKYLHKKT